ncbi:MAG: hypothetical protein K0R76_330 [Alphaproteobacteria bacterium]|jgi:opacity protein-like surface antigen|nr:hypothetical protein [Alphaproteobacteria bacterium]
MKKKLYLKAGTAVAALLMTAVPGQASMGIKSGVYAGISAGLSHLSGNQNLNAANSNPAQPKTDYRMRLSGNSVGASVFAGYGYRVNCTWLAAELSYLFDRIESKQTISTSQNIADKVFKARSTGAFGGAFHIGYIPHEACALYAILGLEMRRFRMNYQNEGAPAPDVYSTNSKSYNSTAFVPGVGARINLAKNVSMRVEYKYALHPSRSTTSPAARNAVIGGTDTSTLKQSPRVQTLHVGFVYSF